MIPGQETRIEHVVQSGQNNIKKGERDCLLADRRLFLLFFFVLELIIRTYGHKKLIA